MKSLEWKTVKSDYVLKDRWIAVRADSCQTPTGQLIEPYYVLNYPDYVQIFALTAAREVVLNYQYRHGIGQTILELPTGTMDTADRSPIETARRELLEETGYGGEQFTLLGQASPNPANHSNLSHFVLALNVKPIAEKIDDPFEPIENTLMPLAEVKQKLFAGEFLQSLHVNALFFGLAHLGEL